MKKQNLHLSRRVSRRVSNSGQATIEYILLMVIVLGAVVGTILQFNKGLERYLTNYMGEYVKCLIESSELPSLGSGSQAYCDQFFEPFSIGFGKPPIDSKNNPYSPQNQAATKDQETTPTATATAYASADSAPSNLVPVGGGKNKDSNLKPKTVPANAKNPVKNGGFEAQKNGEGDLSGTGSGDFDEEGRRRYVYSEEYNSDDATATNKSVPVTAIDRKVASKTVSAEDVKKKIKSSEDEESKMQFSDFLRYLIIAGIVITIIFFFFSQALQISKSND